MQGAERPLSVQACKNPFFRTLLGIAGRRVGRSSMMRGSLDEAHVTLHLFASLGLSLLQEYSSGSANIYQNVLSAV